MNARLVTYGMPCIHTYLENTKYFEVFSDEITEVARAKSRGFDLASAQPMATTVRTSILYAHLMGYT